MGPAVERDYSRFMTGFHEQHDVRRRLYDLVVAQIAGAVSTAETRDAPRDAAKRVVEILRAIATAGGRGRQLASSPSFRRERRDVAVRRVDDQRGVVVEFAIDHVLGAVSGGGAGESIGSAKRGEEDGIASGEIAGAVLENPVSAR